MTSIRASLHQSDSEIESQGLRRFSVTSEELREEGYQLDLKAERALYDALLFDSELPEAYSSRAERALAAHRNAEAHDHHTEARRQKNVMQRYLPFVKTLVRDKLKRDLSPFAPVSLQVETLHAPSVHFLGETHLIPRSLI